MREQLLDITIILLTVPINFGTLVLFFSADDVVLADLERVPSLPVIGDRYSNILHDIPVCFSYTFPPHKMV